jgi:hypothetical protein
MLALTLLLLVRTFQTQAVACGQLQVVDELQASAYQLSSSCQCPMNQATNRVPKVRYVKIRGRVLADATMFPLGTLDWKYTTFIFGAEDRKTHVTPVKISYAFSNADGLLPDSFFDYSKRYELRTVREPQCDESVDTISYVGNVDSETGTPLPRTKILQVLYGAPRELLKPDAVLPCYVLYGRKYRVLSQDPDRITRCFVRVPRELQDATFTVVYTFETKSGRPEKIAKVKNDFLPGGEFTACISRWKIPSMSKGAATFSWSAAEGWTMVVTRVPRRNNATATKRHQ